jgi:hypothetical protein
MTEQAESLLLTIDRLVESKKYDWAKDTLLGIREMVARTGTVTLRQREAVDHIIVGRLRHDVRSVE